MVLWVAFYGPNLTESWVAVPSIGPQAAALSFELWWGHTVFAMSVVWATTWWEVELW